MTTPFCFCAPGRAHPLGGASPLQTRQGELLAERTGLYREGKSEGSRRQSVVPDEQKPHKRLPCRMRRQVTSKSNTCTEGMEVYAAGISVKVEAHYPGRLFNLPSAIVIER